MDFYRQKSREGVRAGSKVMGHPPGPLAPDPERLSHPHRQAHKQTCTPVGTSALRVLTPQCLTGG